MEEMILLQKFVSKDPVRGALNEIVKYGPHLYASDGHMMVRVESDKDPGRSFEWDFKRTLSSYYPTEKVDEIEIDRSRFLHMLNGLPKETIRIESGEFERRECEECVGYGQVTWEYQEWEDEFDCPVCGGAGKGELPVMINREVIKQSIAISFRGLLFNPTLLFRIFSEVDANPKVSIYNETIICQLNKYEFLLMKCIGLDPLCDLEDFKI